MKLPPREQATPTSYVPRDIPNSSQPAPNSRIIWPSPIRKRDISFPSIIPGSRCAADTQPRQRSPVAFIDQAHADAPQHIDQQERDSEPRHILIERINLGIAPGDRTFVPSEDSWHAPPWFAKRCKPGVGNRAKIGKLRQTRQPDGYVRERNG